MYTPPSDLWLPQANGLRQVIFKAAIGKDVILQAVTGGGKSRVAAELFSWALSCNMHCAYYINRKLLIGQTIQEFTDKGLHFGVRAADYEDNYDETAPVQICSAPTEMARVYNKYPGKNIWNHYHADLVVVDEAHIQKGEGMQKIIDAHKNAGAVIIGMTATPIGCRHIYKELIVSGTMDEYRDCKSIVPADVFAFQQPDMRKVKRNATGEYVLNGEEKRIYTHTIVGKVLEMWEKKNPDARPTMLFAPGKPESVWFTEQFAKRGVNWCHIDANDAVVDGKRTRLSKDLWKEIVERYNDNDIKGISSRFKLREGVSLPKTYCGILATPVGSLASYLQIVGRILRYSDETPDRVIINDHGGSFWRHGDPNDDWDWNTLWRMSQGAASKARENAIKNGEVAESIRCPKCYLERSGGFTCPSCGFEHKKSQREVIQVDGTMKLVTGTMVKKKKPPSPHKDWENMFWQWRNGKSKRTMKQLRAVYEKKHGTLPADAPFQPKSEFDWNREVSKVDMSIFKRK